MATGTEHEAKNQLTTHASVDGAYFGDRRPADMTSVEWYDGEPETYSLLVVINSEATTPQQEADAARSVVYDALNEFPFEIELKGHGRVQGGSHDGEVVAALAVYA